MKLPTDLIRMYKEIHGWVGIVAGLALFIAFYAGALTMFEEPLQRWASPPSTLAPAPSLERTPELVAKVKAAYPEAARGYEVNLVIDAAHPGRVSWRAPGGKRGEHGGGATYFASLAKDGALQVEKQQRSQVANFIDVLHQQVGLPLPHWLAMPIMGGISLLYVIAMISGIAVLLPSLVSDLFALRIGRNVKRMWLDLHNLLGLMSLPFHIIIALTAVVFAFHDEFYGAQRMAFSDAANRARPLTRAEASIDGTPTITPIEIVQRLKEQAPGFTPHQIVYGQGGGILPALRVQGSDPRYGQRGPTYGIAGLDPNTAQIIDRNYMPGMQDGWAATTTGLFTLHFGSFGGYPIRWTYFFMGLAGAFLFYTGNLLWVESRRKRERRSGAVQQTRATRILGALTAGVPLGCVAGIAVTLAAAKLLGPVATYGLHSAVYYSVFAAFTIWALVRGAARAGQELCALGALAMLSVPAASIWGGKGLYDHPELVLVDMVATLMAFALLLMASAARSRALAGASDSVWSALPSQPVPELAR
ncbi:PepSY-associated TM helix domain-containing protein [Sphingobium yanoikuyae]|uniref:PepSY-associated TM helix domain-containing protein n=1 Tax=Sphingobium yanoikuyae TaxID=13690 RepID=UPI0022DE1152|nr:PepSY-associated TM helix domain-containing protein [Sphingobium yanoikuyae]WBQ16758.1 PepSY-associated TM helix domain-containing protein [Sphingobium yanoikuyae]